MCCRLPGVVLAVALALCHAPAVTAWATTGTNETTPPIPDPPDAAQRIAELRSYAAGAAKLSNPGDTTRSTTFSPTYPHASLWVMGVSDSKALCVLARQIGCSLCAKDGR
jgi:hypothetical protein